MGEYGKQEAVGKKRPIRWKRILEKTAGHENEQKGGDDIIIESTHEDSSLDDPENRSKR